MKKSQREKDWQKNQDKAVSMTDKFIAVLEQLDCYDSWESILLDRIIAAKKKDAKLNRLPYFDDLIETIESQLPVVCIKVENLAQQTRLEAFIEDLKENPCQLKLIA